LIAGSCKFIFVKINFHEHLLKSSCASVWQAANRDKIKSLQVLLNIVCSSA
jgi:hypothetical protein